MTLYERILSQLGGLLKCPNRQHHHRTIIVWKVKEKENKLGIESNRAVEVGRLAIQILIVYLYTVYISTYVLR